MVRDSSSRRPLSLGGGGGSGGLLPSLSQWKRKRLTYLIGIGVVYFLISSLLSTSTPSSSSYVVDVNVAPPGNPHHPKLDKRYPPQTSFTNSAGRQLKVAFYCLPKPFTALPLGHQERALLSWTRLPFKATIHLVKSFDSDAEEFGAMAKRLGGVVDEVRLDPDGNVMQDELFTHASRNKDADVVVVINADIILFDDFAESLSFIAGEFADRFFFVGARYDAVTDAPIRTAYSNEYFEELQHSPAVTDSVLHSYGGVDYYAWRPGGDPYMAAVGSAMPPFTYGRGKVDNWVVRTAGNMKIPVIDGSLAVKALHFAHSYHGDDSPLSEIDGVIAYKNHWYSAAGKAVDMNRFSFFEFGDVKIQQGVPWEAQYKLGRCLAGGSRVVCMEERVGLPCPCEYNPYWRKTLSPMKKQGNLKVCGVIAGPKSSERPSEADGALLLSAWRAQNDDLIVLGFNSDYIDMLRSTVCRFRQLGVNNYIIVAFNQEALRTCRLDGLPCVSGFDESHIAEAAAATYNSLEFRALTKLKTRQVVRFLEDGYNVLWCDIDVFWFKNVLPDLRDPKYDNYDVLIQSNAPLVEEADNGFKRINSGFYYVKSNPRSIAAFRAIVDHAAKSKYSEQPSFYTVLCGDKMEFTVGLDQCDNDDLEVTTYFLPRSQYPNGNTTLWETLSFPEVQPEGVSIIHNNWIAGHDAKMDRFTKAGLIQYKSGMGCKGF